MFRRGLSVSRLALSTPPGRFVTPENCSLVKLSIEVKIATKCEITVELSRCKLLVACDGFVLACDEFVVEIFEISLHMVR